MPKFIPHPATHTTQNRLVNPKVVRACSIVLSDWEKIPGRALKSAVTLLHRIAFGCKSPAMLYQVSTQFRVRYVRHCCCVCSCATRCIYSIVAVGRPGGWMEYTRARTRSPNKFQFNNIRYGSSSSSSAIASEVHTMCVVCMSVWRYNDEG